MAFHNTYVYASLGDAWQGIAQLGCRPGNAMQCNIFNEICNIERGVARGGACSLLTVSQFNVAIIFVAAIKVEMAESV